MKKILMVRRQWEIDLKNDESDSSYYDEEDSDIQKEILNENKH